MTWAEEVRKTFLEEVEVQEFKRHVQRCKAIQNKN